MKKTKKSRKLVYFCMLFFLYVLVYHLTICPFTRSMSKGTKKFTTQKRKVLNNHKIINCDRSDKFSDICTIDGRTVLDPTTSTLYGYQKSIQQVEKIKPYPRKWESITMRKLKEVTLISNLSRLSCRIYHKSPALVFSRGGSTGNVLVDFNEGLVPLFITVKYIFSQGEDFIIVMQENHDDWAEKYSDLLRAFTKHPVINMDKEKATHCFPSAAVGLITHGYMAIDPTLLPKPITFLDFHNFVARAYGDDPAIRRRSASSPPANPRLLLMSRKGSKNGRVLLNEEEVTKLGRELGFDVTVVRLRRASKLREFYELASLSDAMVGVHGSALVHCLYMRPGSVFLQVIPLGNEELAEVYYGNPAREMGLDYMKYKILPEESSLADKYDINSMMIQDPVAYIGKNWSNTLLDVYKKEQDVRLDLGRFKETLKNVYKKATVFRDNKFH